jgi:predicted ATPase/class 3 adenylate cyclase
LGELPSGTVTFLFTDIEGSTRLWDEHLGAMRLALARHDALLRAAIETNNGHVFKTMGDAFCAAFGTAAEALDAALAAQLNLLKATPSATGLPAALKVRMALHTGAADLHAGDYFGPTLNRVARLLAMGYGGQILLSEAAQTLVRDDLPPGARLKELGVHRLRDLQRAEQVFQLLHPELPADFPALRSLDALPNNLPQQVTSFIGRERELAQVQALLTKSRLLTLTGSGGCGKTRLALQVAAEVLEDYPDGVWLVELASLAEASLVPPSAAGVLGVKEEPGRPLLQTLVEALKAKRLLLLLDNCEHLLAACAQLADALLRQCPRVLILVTSREGLGIAGETTYGVPSLSLPDPSLPPSPESLAQCEAVRLFSERAGQVQTSFAVTNENARAVASVCHRLDGIPLAIELAAARVKALPVEKLNERLDDRFRLLTGGSRTALPRQQTLRALIDWSYDLLSELERVLLRRLSVFAGGWTLEAAEAACTREGVEEWEVLDLLTSLVEKSLVLYEERGGEGRYRLLETVRQYARDRLLESGDVATVRARHRDWFLRLAERSEPGLAGADVGKWLNRLEMEHDNLRMTLDWSIESGDGEAGLRAGAALQEFWWVRGYHSEARERLTRLMGQTTVEAFPTAYAKVLNAAGRLAWAQRDLETARALHEQALAIAGGLGDQTGRAASLHGLGNVAHHQGDLRRAQALHEESLAVRRGLCDKGGMALSLHALGWVASGRGDFETARALHQESLTIWRELSDRGHVISALDSLGCVVRDQGDLDTASLLFQEALALAQELGDREHIAWAITHLGWVAQNRGDNAAARALYEQSIAIWRELGYTPGLMETLRSFGRVARRQGESATAQALFAEALAISQRLDDKEGIAWSFFSLGEVARDQADWERAAALFGQSLRVFSELPNRLGRAHCLAGLAAAAAVQARPDRAARLFGAAEALWEAVSSPRAPLDDATEGRQAAIVREALGEEACAAAWQAGRAMPMEQAVAYALEEAGDE